MEFYVPKEFLLLGRTYKVSQPTKVDSKGSLGDCDSATAMIKVRRNLKKELKEHTYLHEVTHAILDSLGYEKLSMDEKFVDSFSGALYQVLKTAK